MQMAVRLLGLMALATTVAANESALRATDQFMSRQRVGAPQPGMSTAEVVKALSQVVESIEDEEKDAKVLQKKRETACVETKRDLETSVAHVKRTLTQAEDDLKMQEAGVEETETEINSIKSDVAATNKELDNLGGKLQQLRDDFKSKRNEMEAGLEQIDQVVMIEEAKRSATALQSAKKVSKLHALAGELRDSMPAPSFVQTSMEQAPADVLESEKEKLLDSGDSAKEAFRAEEEKLMDLHEEQEKRLHELTRSMRAQQPVLNDKLEALAEVNRTLASNRRSLARDEALLEADAKMCAVFRKNAEEQEKIRDKVYTTLRMAVKMLESAEGTTVLLAKDVSSLADRLPLAFVQLSSRSRAVGPAEATAELFQGLEGMNSDGPVQASPVALGLISESQSSGGDPFAEVKEMLKQLVANLKAEANKDTDRQQFCEKGKAQIRKERQTIQDEISSKQAEARWTRAAIARLSDEASFLTGEVARLKKAAEESRMELTAEKERTDGLKKDHGLARDIISKAVTIVSELCDLPSNLLQLPSGPLRRARLLQTHRVMGGSRWTGCTEAYQYLTETVELSEQQDSLLGSEFNDFKTLAEAMISDADNAAMTKDNELQQSDSTKAARQDALVTAETDLKNAQEKLKKNGQAKDEMDTSCSPGVETHEDRQRRRQEEIDALKNALQVLQGETIPVDGASLAQVDQPDNQQQKLAAVQTALAAAPGVEASLSGPLARAAMSMGLAPNA